MTLPRAMQRVIATAVARAPERAADIDRHYGQLMPHQRAEQLQRDLMRAPLRWDRLPRMRRAIARLAAVLDDALVDASLVRAALRARTLGELYATTYYGAAMPLLYANPADLAYFESRKLTVDDTIDRYLTAPIIHELCHLDRERDALCPHLDECVAGWLGVHVWPEFAYPAPGHDDALYASPWLAQIGAAMVRTFGRGPVLRAHAGLAGLPHDFLGASERLYWKQWDRDRPLHFLANTMQPRPWLDLIVDGRELAPDPAADRQIVTDALRAMCLETELVAGSFRTRTVLPTAPIVIEQGSVTTAPKNALDTVPPWYWLPPTVEVAERREVRLASLEDIPALAASLVP